MASPTSNYELGLSERYRKLAVYHIPDRGGGAGGRHVLLQTGGPRLSVYRSISCMRTASNGSTRLVVEVGINGAQDAGHTTK
jgi:hypothetical protein